MLSPHLSRLVAEVIGTFFLVIAALLSPPSLTFALVGATLLIMVVVLGPVSGAHLNPAVTAGLVAARLVPLRQGLWYVLAQVVGAFLALGFGALVGRELPVPDPHANALWFELLGTALLVFVVTRVVLAKPSPAASALAIGVALMVGIAVAGPSSGGVLNPAIALVLLTNKLLQGAGGLSVGYVIAPLAAGAVAAWLATLLAPAASSTQPVPRPDDLRELH